MNVLFDLGNVLINFDHRIISQRLIQYVLDEHRTPALQSEVHEFIFGNGVHPSMNAEIDRGTKDINDLRAIMAERFQLNIPQSDFEEIWSSIFADDLNANAMACLNQLRGHGLNVAICSNTNPAHWNPLLKKHPELHALGEQIKCFLSYEIGKQKADPGFFQGIANATNAPPEHHVLIDDLEANCKAAESIGMHSILYLPDNPEESINRINEFVSAQSWV
jgi:putative hydrolase of the HAD superfamily